MPKSTLWATEVPTAGKMPIALTGGRIANGWVNTNYADVAVVSSDVALGATHSIELVSAEAVVTLPSPIGLNGRVYNIVRIGSDNVTILTDDGSTISGDSNLTLTSQWDSVVVVAVDSLGVLGWVRCS
mgnify:CR=1 FL=1